MLMDLAALVALETSVWEALRQGDASGDADHLAQDFLGVYPTGFADRDDHTGQLSDGPTVVDYVILDARSMQLSADHALLAYRAEYRRPGAEQMEEMYVSSVWSQRNGAWINVFSQDTPVDLTANVP